MSSKHIAASGKRAGQWVTCLAPKGECPLGGHHVDEMELKKVQEWAGRRAFVDLNADDYKDYLKSKIAGTLEQDKRELETLEEKRARLGEDQIVQKPKKRQPGTKLRDSEKAAKDAMNASPDGIINSKDYYDIVFQDYPEVVALSVDKQKAIQDYLDTKYGKWAPTRNYTDRERELKRIIENGDINNKAKLKRDSEARLRAREERIQWVSTLPDAKAKKSKLDSKVDEVIGSLPVSKPVNKPVSEPKVVNNFDGIQDYAPLNQGTATEAALLTQLQSYQGERGAFGKISRKTRILEKLVHNQIVFDGNSDSYSFEKKSITRYARRVEDNINMAQGNINTIESSSRGQSSAKTLKVMEAKLDKYIADRERTETIEKNVHDNFVKASKKELITDLFRKGYDNSEHALKVASATKASEIYSLKSVIDKLVKRDEFDMAGL